MTRRNPFGTLVPVGLIVGAVVHASPAWACAGCRNPALAVTRGTEGPLDDGAFRFGATVTGTTVHVVHQAGCSDMAACSERPVQPTYLHDQRLYPVELRLAAEYGLTPALGIELQLPVRAVATTIEYTTPDGAPYEPIDPGVHHRNETIFGVADIWLLARVGGTAHGFWLAARPGVSLPTGSTEEDPFELGDRGLRHQHIQLGSGTFDPIVVVEASRSLGKHQLQFFAQGQFPLYDNSHGYRAPLRVYGGSSLGTEVVASLRGALGVEAFHESAEEWDGKRRQDGNLGRTELLAAATLAHTRGATELTIGFRFPVWRHIVAGDEPPGTLSSPVTVSLGVSHVLGRR